MSYQTATPLRWKYNGSFLELQAEQRSEEWFEARRFRLTASKTQVFVTGESKFDNLDTELNRLMGLEPGPQMNAAMQYGVENEARAIAFYESKTGRKVLPVSLCIPVWGEEQLHDPLHPNWFIAASPDGIISKNRIIEVKCPQRLPWMIQRKLDGNDGGDGSPGKVQRETLNRNRNRIGRDPYWDIYLSHMMQMQQCMAVTKTGMCDYFVDPKGRGVSPDVRAYHCVVKAGSKYWREFMYPELVDLIETRIKPSMTAADKERFAKCSNDMIKAVRGWRPNQ